MDTLISPLPAPSPAPIYTARLTLRPYSLSDEAPFFALLDANRDRLQKAFPTRVATVQTLADARHALAEFARDWQSGKLYVFGIWHADTSEYLGDISLKPTWTQPVSAEIGYYLGASAEGQGFAREALVAAVQFGFGDFLQAGRLTLRCHADNPRSCAVARHVGFQQVPKRQRLWPLRPENNAEILHFALLQSQASAA